MPKYGKYTFPENAVLKRRAGSDWLEDVNKKAWKVRTWKAAEGRWDLTALGKDYYKQTGGAEWVVSIPCHYMILRRRDGAELQCRGYFPVSQMPTGLKERLQLSLIHI